MTCRTCSTEFTLRPDKPGYANECEECTYARGRWDLSVREEVRIDTDRAKYYVRRVMGSQDVYHTSKAYESSGKGKSRVPKDRRG
jgi:hypothetical protein